MESQLNGWQVTREKNLRRLMPKSSGARMSSMLNVCELS